MSEEISEHKWLLLNAQLQRERDGLKGRVVLLEAELAALKAVCLEDVSICDVRRHIKALEAE